MYHECLFSGDDGTFSLIVFCRCLEYNSLAFRPNGYENSSGVSAVEYFYRLVTSERRLSYIARRPGNVHQTESQQTVLAVTSIDMKT